jgi:hypothetical protein
VAQVAFSAAHAPATHEPLQQFASAEHVLPSPMQVHAPWLQPSEQQSPSAAQLPPGAPQPPPDDPVLLVPELAVAVEPELPEVPELAVPVELEVPVVELALAVVLDVAALEVPAEALLAVEPLLPELLVPAALVLAPVELPVTEPAEEVRLPADVVGPVPLLELLPDLEFPQPVENRSPTTQTAATDPPRTDMMPFQRPGYARVVSVRRRKLG